MVERTNVDAAISGEEEPDASVAAEKKRDAEAPVGKSSSTPPDAGQPEPARDDRPKAGAAAGGNAAGATGGTAGASGGAAGASGPRMPPEQCGECNEYYPCVDRPDYTCRGQFTDWAPVYSTSSFTLNNDGTVSDSRTRLIWQRELRTSYPNCSSTSVDGLAGCTQDEAKQYCAGLSIGKRSWRLPTLAEIDSLLDDSERDARLPAQFFPIPEDFNYKNVGTWTASPVANSPGEFWFVDMNEGWWQRANVSVRKLVRCVSEAQGRMIPGGAPSRRYSFPELGVVYDRKTKLTWQRDPGTDRYLPPAAAERCSTLKLGSGSWRLPTRDELVTLFDPTHIEPAIDGDAFPGTPFDGPTPLGGFDNAFWTSTIYGDMNLWRHWFVHFGKYGAGTERDDHTLYVRCVR